MKIFVEETQKALRSLGEEMGPTGVGDPFEVLLSEVAQGDYRHFSPQLQGQLAENPPLANQWRRTLEMVSDLEAMVARGRSRNDSVMGHSCHFGPTL